jgi:hypothetical protein
MTTDVYFDKKTGVEWKTFIVNGTNGYKIDYPSDSTINRGILDLSVRFVSSYGIIYVECPMYQGPHIAKLPTREEYKTNEPVIGLKYFKDVIINGMNAVQYIFLTSYKSGSIHTALLRKSNPYVCGIWKTYNSDENDYQNIINKDIIYTQMVNSFAFIE